MIYYLYLYNLKIPYNQFLNRQLLSFLLCGSVISMSPLPKINVLGIFITKKFLNLDNPYLFRIPSLGCFILQLNVYHEKNSP